MAKASRMAVRQAQAFEEMSGRIARIEAKLDTLLAKFHEVEPVVQEPEPEPETKPPAKSRAKK
jgi:uncharacterized coiled-coil protein SlyX